MLAVARTTAEHGLESDGRELQRFRTELDRLEEVIRTQADQLPGADAFARQLRGMTAIADQESVDLLTVAPQPAQALGPYLVNDIKVGARGRSDAFLRFLDHLAREDPYQSLRAWSISRAPQPAGDQCELAWTLRFYLLPTAAELAQGGRR